MLTFNRNRFAHHIRIPAAVGRVLAGLLLSAASVGWAFASATAAAGYAVTSFATGFTYNIWGPIGVAFDVSGNLFVMNKHDGFLYKFGPAGGVASAATRVNTTPIAGSPDGLAFAQDGRLYLSRPIGGGTGDVVELDPATGTVIRTVAPIPFATGLATDPLSGDLFVSCSLGIVRISNFANGPGTVTLYASRVADGIAFGADGTLYVASGGAVKIDGTNSATPGKVTFLIGIPFIDGIAVSADPTNRFLYANRNDGTITKIDLTTVPPTLTNIVTGGTRGDFATVGFDGCLYATQTDSVLKVTNADGTCVPPPLGPLTPSTPVFLSSGSFVIGDLNAAVGNFVTFWGAQWANVNSLSGGPAPNDFKGFAANAPRTCAGNWTSSPGNSSVPPNSVPSLMAVLASSSVNMPGAAISGNIPKIVIVRTNPGYGPDPSYAGTGTVVAVFCGH